MDQESAPRRLGDDYPERSARTRKFTLGAPRAFTVSPDDQRIAFLRSNGPEDAIGRLWVWDVPARAQDEVTDRLVADPIDMATVLAAQDSPGVPAAELARRERMRESGAGITAYSTDAAVRSAVFALEGHLFWCSLQPSTGTPVLLDVPGPVVDPRLSPDGRVVAWVRDHALWCVRLGDDGELAGEPVRLSPEEADPDAITWGLADFIAAEELDRLRGYWFSPDSRAILVERVDATGVERTWISDPTYPRLPPREVRYPAAGTPNARLGLWLCDLPDESPGDAAVPGAPRPVTGWDPEAHEYLGTVVWNTNGAAFTVLDRPQREAITYVLDPASGEATEKWRETDPHWVDTHPRVPALLSDGSLLVLRADRDSDTYRLAASRNTQTGDVAWISPPGLQIRSLIQVSDGTILAQTAPQPRSSHLALVNPHGALVPLNPPSDRSWHSATRGTHVIVETSASLDSDTEFRVLRTHLGADADPTDLPGPPALIGQIHSHAESPALDIHPEFREVGPLAIRTALLWPEGHRVRGGARLPVILCPYGGPHGQRVVAARNVYADAQWLANQGFAVIIADGRGTPGRGPNWDREVAGDLATKPLADQVAMLGLLAEEYPDDLDLDRVGIMGWSFGGYLAALALLRRPDVFHAAIAGAPVTDWMLYDTAYTERYLGQPGDIGEAYAHSSILDDAPKLRGQLLLIHGLADDNVLPAHSLQLSARLLAAGREHRLMPLAGVSHMTPQVQVAANLLRLEAEFFTEVL